MASSSISSNVLRGSLAVLAALAVASLVSSLAWGFAGGPPAGVSGGPRERTCGACHRGAPPLPDTLRIETLPYVAGRPQRIRITTTELSGAYGFQASMRFWNAPRGQAGQFRPSPDQRVACATPDLAVEIAKPGAHCPDTHPLEYVMHANPLPDPVIEVEWVAPERTSEPVIFYLSFNSVNLDGSFGGDRFQTMTVMIPPAGLRTLPGRRNAGDYRTP